jgi:hypothetical protein
MRILFAMVVGLLLCEPPTVVCEGPPLGGPQVREIMVRMMAALAPGIRDFPATDDSGATPVGGNTQSLWMVRHPHDDERTIEVLANPLNEENQLKATRAMAQIERNIEAAQRRAAAQYDRAVAEAKRTGRSQEVDGVTLADEGIEGAKIDAESHVTIDVSFNEKAYLFTITTADKPVVTAEHAGAITMIAFPAGTYRDEATNTERYAEAETLVFMGRMTAPQVTKRADHSYEVLATATPTDREGLNTLVVRYRGNETLVGELPTKMAWGLLLELIN